jgi:hypothetical protein
MPDNVAKIFKLRHYPAQNNVRFSEPKLFWAQVDEESTDDSFLLI